MTTIKNEITLRVKEALVKDVGRAIARIDPKDIIAWTKKQLDGRLSDLKRDITNGLMSGPPPAIEEA